VKGVALAVPVRAAAAQRGAQLVGGDPQVGLVAAAVGVAVPVVAQAVDEALPPDAGGVGAVAAVGRVADDVVEQADARAGHVVLLGVAVGAGGQPLVPAPSRSPSPRRRGRSCCRPRRPRADGERLHRGLQIEHVLLACGSSSGRSGSRPPCTRSRSAAPCQPSASASWRIRWRCPSSRRSCRARRRRRSGSSSRAPPCPAPSDRPGRWPRCGCRPRP
jgi:hypothetical protein